MKRLTALLWLAVFAGLLVYLGFTAWLALAGLVYPYQFDYGEGAMLEQARLISQGRSIYKGMEGYPYAFSNYPPLVQALAALLVPLLGVTYAAGRIWNVLALFGLAALIYHVVRRQGGDRRRPLPWPPCASPARPTSTTGRPSSGWTCRACALRPGRGGGGRGGQDRAAVLGARPGGRALCGGLYSKHSYLAAPAAAFALPVGAATAATRCACWPPRWCWAAGSSWPSTAATAGAFALT